MFALTAITGLLFAAGDKDAVSRILKKTVDDVLVVVRNKKLNRQQVKDQVMAVVSPVFDFDVMAKLTLGRTHWPKLKDEQRQEFTDLFIQQLQASYLDKVELVSDEKVLFDEPVEEGRGKIAAATRVLSKEETIKLVYKFRKEGGAWKVYDVVIQDVSLVKSYSQQYQQILQQGSVSDLLRKMQEKISQTEQQNRLKRQNRKTKKKT